MFKKSLLFLGMLVSLFSSNQPAELPEQPNKDNTVLVVELHNVTMRYTRVNFWCSLVKLMINADNKQELIKLYFDDSFWENVDTAIQMYKIGELIIHDLCIQYPQLARYEEDLNRLAVVERWKPRAEMIYFLKKLKEKGYAIYGIANMGPNAQDLTDKTYEQDFEVFNDFIIPEDAQGATLDRPEFYTTLHNELCKDGHGNKQVVIFVSKDDMIRAAQDSGLIVYLYKSSKQFKTTLQQLGLF